MQPLAPVGAEVPKQRFEIWDGPGGGPKSTGITVNPGDDVSIHAEGLIWSGIFASGPPGPDGWPGFAAR